MATETNKLTTPPPASAASTTTATTTAPPDGSGSKSFFERRMGGHAEPKRTLADPDGTGTTSSSTTTATTTPLPEPASTSTSTSTAPPASTRTKTTTKPPRAAGYRDVPAGPADDRVSTAAVKDIVETIMKAGEKKNSPPAVELNDEEKEQIAVLTVMETLYPNKYPAGFAKKVADFIPKVVEFEERTRKENPDISDEDLEKLVEDLHEKNGIVWEDKDFSKAELKREIAPLVDENKDLKVRLEQRERKDKSNDLAPKAQASATAAGKDLANDFAIEGTDGKKIEISSALKSDGSFDEAQVKVIVEADPIAAPLIFDAIERSQNIGMEVMRTYHGDGRSDLEDDIMFIQSDLENKMMALPPEERTDKKGRVFLGMIEFVAGMKRKNPKFAPTPARCRQMIEELGYCTTTEEALVVHANEMIADGTKKAIASKRAEVERLAPRLGYSKQAQTNTLTTTAPPDPVEKPDTTHTPDATASAATANKTAAESAFWKRRETGTRVEQKAKLT